MANLNNSNNNLNNKLQPEDIIMIKNNKMNNNNNIISLNIINNNNQIKPPLSLSASVNGNNNNSSSPLLDNPHNHKIYSFIPVIGSSLNPNSNLIISSCSLSQIKSQSQLQQENHIKFMKKINK
jgi:hypothetical protein